MNCFISLVLLLCFALFAVDDATTSDGIIMSHGPFVNNKAELPTNVGEGLIEYNGENITLTLLKSRVNRPLFLPLIATNSAFQLSFTARREEGCIEDEAIQKWIITYPSKSQVVPLSIVWWDYAATVRYENKPEEVARSLSRTSVDIFLDGKSVAIKGDDDTKRSEPIPLLSPLEAPSLPDKNFNMSFSIANVNEAATDGACDITLEFNGAAVKIYKLQPYASPEPNEDFEPTLAASTPNANNAEHSEKLTVRGAASDDLMWIVFGSLSVTAIIILGIISTCCFYYKHFHRSQKTDQTMNVESGVAASKPPDAPMMVVENAKVSSECMKVTSECDPVNEEVIARDCGDGVGAERRPDKVEVPIKFVNQKMYEQQPESKNGPG